ncbi:hypothetical protein KBD33_05525 [Candidatus Gracilibacteria bacterium]|nr:hypothetical protein [Candidatus Gracilibacteria bacterium]
MNTPAEPEGGRKGHSEIKITLLASSGKPWTEGVIEQNGRKYRVRKDGSVMLVPNGGEKYANRKTITRIVNEQVQQGVAHIILQHDAWSGTIKLQQE